VSDAPFSRESARSAIGRAAVEQFEARPRDTGIRRTGKPVAVSHEPRPTTEWVVVIPVKGTDDAKSRFGDSPQRAELALAIALDTVSAALAATSVIGVLVVTSTAAAAGFDDLEALVVIEEQPSGLGTAIASGIATAAELGAPGRGIAVLLGDLPALTSRELDLALAAAAEHPLAMVADAAGAGTTLVTAADGQVHSTAFGPGSRQAHLDAGYTELDIPVDSGLRTDVDTIDELHALAARVGKRTAALLG